MEAEVGLKMRSAIKAKLTELGCYVDDELPDYVMVMVANKRTRAQMEEDLQLFLSNNTESFVSWLHQVLQKLQEVTISKKLLADKKKTKKDKPSSSKKDQKEKKKEKSKAKEKAKIKLKKAKKEKVKKTPVKSEESETIRPNIPRLLMNLEKESSPSITDIFAGQILKKHGITSNVPISSISDVDIKDIAKRKRTRLPIIDPATVDQLEGSVYLPSTSASKPTPPDSFDIPPITAINPKEEKKETSAPKVVAAESGSDYEDYLNIRTEADDLLDAELDDAAPTASDGKVKDSDVAPKKSVTRKLIEPPKDTPKLPDKEFQQIELNLPKRPLRERLGVRESDVKKKNVNLVRPMRSPIVYSNDDNSNRNEERNKKSSNNDRHIRSRITLKVDDKPSRNRSNDENPFKRRLGSRVVPLIPEPYKPNPVAVASIVRAPPRPPGQGISAGPQMLLRAMADAHKSLINMPQRQEIESPKKKAMVLPMRRNVNPQKIIIEVPSSRVMMKKPNNSLGCNADFDIDMDVESLDDLEYGDGSSLHKENEYIPVGSKTFNEIDYVPTNIDDIENDSQLDQLDIVEIPKILNSSNGDERKSSTNPQFVVTLDGLDPNVFLEKKLEMISQESDEEDSAKKTPESVSKTNEEQNDAKDDQKDFKKMPLSNFKITFNGNGNRIRIDNVETKTDSSEPNGAKNSSISTKNINKKSSKEDEASDASHSPETTNKETSEPPRRKRKASPIVFNVHNDKESKSSTKPDNSSKGSKYDSIPALLTDRHRMCRAFPMCSFGDKCAYPHPPCKYNASCVRKDCPYSHSSSSSRASSKSAMASHVVASGNYKTISSPLLPSLCKYHPSCTKVGCAFYHPVPCRFGKKCLNKVECNFYHHNVSSLKWKSPHAT